MHHSHGAFSETLYLYGECLKLTFEKISQPRVLSVGLGLGYNEILVACYSIAQKALVAQLVTYEKDLVLRNEFLNFLKNPDSTSEFAGCYQTILGLFSRTFALDSTQVVLTLQQWQHDGVWQLNASWTPDLAPPVPFHSILYDPFSRKTNPEFWSQSNLSLFLNRWCGSPCVFSTYAATGVLTRALQSHDFVVNKRAGFGGKRECTMAVRSPALSSSSI
jgi:hypothetical protein